MKENERKYEEENNFQDLFCCKKNVKIHNAERDISVSKLYLML